ncbi:hypothetical protein AB0H43_04995 [Hamadaea sp. NPDC050747]
MHGPLSMVLTAMVAVQPTAHPANDLAQALQRESLIGGLLCSN